jgi:hypothetical protein
MRRTGALALALVLPRRACQGTAQHAWTDGMHGKSSAGSTGLSVLNTPSASGSCKDLASKITHNFALDPDAVNASLA